MTSLRTHLAAAVRAVNAAYDHLPKSTQATIDLRLDPLERKIDKALAADDEAAALAAIAAWRDHWCQVFKDRGGARPDPRTAI